MPLPLPLLVVVEGALRPLWLPGRSLLLRGRVAADRRRWWSGDEKSEMVAAILSSSSSSSGTEPGTEHWKKERKKERKEPKVGALFPARRRTALLVAGFAGSAISIGIEGMGCCC